MSHIMNEQLPLTMITVDYGFLLNAFEKLNLLRNTNEIIYTSEQEKPKTVLEECCQLPNKCYCDSSTPLLYDIWLRSW